MSKFEWVLHGGPNHGSYGSGKPPQDYAFDMAVADLPDYLSFQLRDAEHLFRWIPDIRDMQDGLKLIHRVKTTGSQFMNGVGSDLGNVALMHGFTTLRDYPEMDDAQDFRDHLASMRKNGHI